MVTPEGNFPDPNSAKLTESLSALQAEDVLEDNAVEAVEDPDQKAIRLGQDRGL